MVITSYNSTTEQLEKTFLTQPVSAGVTSLTVKNNNKLAANDRIMVGEMGLEKTEILTVTSVSGGTAVVSGATVFSHDADDPIYQLRFDQVKFYRSTTGSTGTYTLLTTVAMDVDNAEKITTYDDTTGVSTYYYKISYYHSISTLESSLSDPVPGTGYARNTVGYLVDEVLRLVGDDNEKITDRTEIIGWMNDCSDDMLSRAVRPYSFLHTRTTLTRTIATNTIAFPVDSSGNETMWKFDRMDYAFTDTSVTPNTTNTYTLEVLAPEEFRNRFQSGLIDSTTENDQTTYMAIDDAVNLFRFQAPFKTTQAAAFYLYFWKFFTNLDTLGDAFETPTIRPYRTYVLWQFYLKKSSRDVLVKQMADSYEQQYVTEVSRLSGNNRKDVGSPRSFTYLPQTKAGWRSN